MAVATRTQPNTDPPPIDPPEGENRLAWHPQAMADHVFPEPSKRELAYAAEPVDKWQERAAEEVRWLHEIIEHLRTRITELEASGASTVAQSRRRAELDAERIRGDARMTAARIVADAHHKAEKLMAEALDRVGAAERAAGETTESSLPPVDARDPGGSLHRRFEHATSLMAQVRAEADEMYAAADAVRRALTRPATDLAPARPDEDAERFYAARLDDHLEALTNRSDQTVMVTVGASTRAVNPGDTVHIDPQALTGATRAHLDGVSPPALAAPVPVVPDGYNDPDDPPARILRDAPEHGLRAGMVVPESYVPSGVLFETVPAEYRSGARPEDEPVELHDDDHTEDADDRGDFVDTQDT